MSIVYRSGVANLDGGLSASAAAVAYCTSAGTAPTTAFPGGITATVGAIWESPSTPGTYGCPVTLSGPLPAGYELRIGWTVGAKKLDDTSPTPVVDPLPVGVAPGASGGLPLIGSAPLTHLDADVSSIPGAVLADPTHPLQADSSGRVLTSRTQVLDPPREVTSVASGSITVNDAAWGAVVGAGGRADWTSTGGTVSTPSGDQVYRTFTIATSSTSGSRS